MFTTSHGTLNRSMREENNFLNAKQNNPLTKYLTHSKLKENLKAQGHTHPIKKHFEQHYKPSFLTAPQSLNSTVDHYSTVISERPTHSDFNQLV
jgi:hypothetical protein